MFYKIIIKYNITILIQFHKYTQFLDFVIYNISTQKIPTLQSSETMRALAFTHICVEATEAFILNKTALIISHPTCSPERISLKPANIFTFVVYSHARGAARAVMPS